MSMPQFRKHEEDETGSTVDPPMELEHNLSAYDRSAALPDDVESLKRAGNDFLENEKYLQAVYQYTMAIQKIPTHPVFYLNRATAYMRRNWLGDVYAGLRDCQTALTLDPTYEKAHFRLARALFTLGYVDETSECVTELRNRFPSHAKNKSVLMLMKEIEMEQKKTVALEEAALVETNQELVSHFAIRFCGQGDHFAFLFQRWRARALDYAERFIGHCNVTTDIKEANYLGNDGNYVIAG